LRFYGIHPTSIISKEAEVHPECDIGPFCFIEGKVSIGKGTKLDSHVRIGNQHGIIEIGEHNHFFAGSVIGGYPQDRGYKGEDTKVVIGKGNQFRECVTISLGTLKGRGQTVIGNDNLFMAYVHFGHDCIVGSGNFVANSVNLQDMRSWVAKQQLVVFARLTNLFALVIRVLSVDTVR